jgi:CrcB protein
MLTGFMGAFTTFSTYMFETSQLLGASQWMWAAANFLGQNALGFLVLMLGSWLARSI